MPRGLREISALWFHRRIHSEPDAVRAAGDLAQDFRIHSARRAGRARILRSGLAFVAGIFAWFIGLALLLIALEGRRSRDHLGVPVHQSVFCSLHERGRAGVRAQSFWCF